MFIKKNIIIYLLIAVALLLCSSCKKNLITTSSSAKLNFQEDTVKFDTVFTTQGSATQSLKIYNHNSEKINISNIHLAGGSGSMFRMNVDGTPTYSINNVQIAAHDSLYIFVAVTINPGIPNNPFVVTDSILFTTNGNNQKVILDAYGQNAHFFNGDSVCNVTWTNDKPYVIINSLLVPKGCTLTINPGVRVYMHYGSYLIVKGTLIVGPNSTAQDSVVFQVDRLEDEYSGVPGQWGGIVFIRGSTGNILTHAVINEATYGIISGSLYSDTSSTSFAGFNSANASIVTLNGCIIKNCQYDGIFSYCSNITATNTLIYSCGQDNVSIYIGGTYNFYSCTLADFNSSYISHTNPLVSFSNRLVSNNVTLASNPLSLNFVNTIVYGDISNGDEIVGDSISSAPFNYLFQNCLITTQAKTPSVHYIFNLLNANPFFVNETNSDYHLENISPCINTGNSSFEPAVDLDGYFRVGNVPDIGCYEYH
jgi:hypothetical protein